MIAVCFVLMPQTAMAQLKIAVEVGHQGKDPVGSRLAYQVKEGIRRSAGLRLTNSNEPRAIMRLITVGMTEYPQTSSIYGYTLTHVGAGVGEMFMISGVGECGSKVVNEIAERLIATIDKEVEEVRKASPK
jgi:hypothetical protein